MQLGLDLFPPVIPAPWPVVRRITKATEPLGREIDELRARVYCKLARLTVLQHGHDEQRDCCWSTCLDNIPQHLDCDAFVANLQQTD